MENELRYFITREIAKSMLKAAPLDPTDVFTARIVAQSELLSQWTGTTPELVATDRDTCAHGPTCIIGINVRQLRDLFEGFTDDQLDTALIFALAHEFGHIVQSMHFSEGELAAFESILVEAHADVLGGVWMGVRLHGGEPRLPSYLRATGLRLKGDETIYPSAFQRATIIERGMADAVTLAEFVDPKIQDAGYTPIKAGLTRQDVRDLLKTAESVLEYTPKEPPDP